MEQALEQKQRDYEKRPNLHLLQRNGHYYARLSIPPSRRHAFNGRTSLVQALRTTKLNEARGARNRVIAALQKEIDQVGGNGAKGLPLRFSRKLLKTAQDLRKAEAKAHGRGDIARALDIIEEIAGKALAIEESGNATGGRTFAEVAWGEIAVIENIETWLQSKPFTEKTKADHRSAINRFVMWMESEELASTVKTVSKRVASRFKLEDLQEAGVHPKTANKLLSGLRTYWKWLLQHFAEDDANDKPNPFAGLSFDKQRVPRSEQERPFTDEEVVKLFSGDADLQMRDVMAIGALSGMRVEEIFRLTVADCEGDCFNITKSKTQAGEREVPIHSALKAIVARRRNGKGKSEFLIEEAFANGWDGQRSMVFTKRFMRYRKACGVDDVVEGHRRSRVNYHSFRRFFVTKADRAGCREQDVARVVGHKLQTMSFGLYSGSIEVEQRRAVVEAVSLPSGIVIDGEGFSRARILPKLRKKRR